MFVSILPAPQRLKRDSAVLARNVEKIGAQKQTCIGM